ncbi:Glycosyltransferase, GT2 family [Allochromatium warmingii]|uniref:Glycosyltransferase, GT2 family n=1 Tax=Allochromatium warmingii TaxID=61595 RepID=A0A1H3E6C1_ALLWA|nr:glycosyltransferase [Allochromatium warmingii]SDX73808.1 Glycosyltransferase, GT2 family [Allochromatium warmingii]
MSSRLDLGNPAWCAAIVALDAHTLQILLDHPPPNALIRPVTPRADAPVGDRLCEAFLIARLDNDARAERADVIAVSSAGLSAPLLVQLPEAPALPWLQWPERSRHDLAASVVHALLALRIDSPFAVWQPLIAALPSLHCRRVDRLNTHVLYLELHGSWPRLNAVWIGPQAITPARLESRPLERVGQDTFAYLLAEDGANRSILLLSAADGRVEKLELTGAHAPVVGSVRDHLESLDRHTAILHVRQREALGTLLRRANALEQPWAGILTAMQRWRPLPVQTITLSAQDGMRLDAAIPSEHGLLVTGEMSAAFNQAPLSVMLPTGEAMALTPLALGATGQTRRFVAYLPVNQGAAQCRQVRGQCLLPDGRIADLMSPLFEGGVREARRAILEAVPPEACSPTVLATALHPALQTLQRTLTQQVTIETNEAIGKTPAHPQVSLIIPLYQEYGFLRAQMQAWAFDPDRDMTEILYVLDKPEDAHRVRTMLDGLHRLFAVPCRLLVLNANGGYARATNLGASVARGQTLVLLNSDVVPTRSGWLGRWLAWHRRTINPGVSGPRLLYADGALQHAGLFFEQGLMPWWTNNHYYKGFPGHHAAALVSRPVPAVTGACLMVQRDLFATLGGLSEDYVVGDFEDSDFCLRIRAQGGICGYYAAEALYHFERRSVSSNTDYTRTLAAWYNGWLHSTRFGTQIADVMSGFAPTSALLSGMPRD